MFYWDMAAPVELQELNERLLVFIDMGLEMPDGAPAPLKYLST